MANTNPMTVPSSSGVRKRANNSHHLKKSRESSSQSRHRSRKLCNEDAQFRHNPLDLNQPTIRLLEILPGTGVVHCILRHARTFTVYTALSYVWGSPSPQHSIKINGKPWTVRQNLFDFLTEMRSRGVRDAFWIDAICIDQGNILERNHQVTQMAEIYRNAQRAIYWLGKEAAFTNTGFDLRVPTELDQGKLRSPEEQAKGKVRELYDQSIDTFRMPSTARVLASLASKDYWKRTWIVQEVLLSRQRGTVTLGHMDLPWAYFAALCWECDLLRHCCDYFIVWGAFEKTPLHRLLVLDRTMNLSQGGLDPYSVIRACSTTVCSDSKDRVFAVRMIMKHPMCIRVDYSLSKLDLFFELVQSSLGSSAPLVESLVEALDLCETDFGKVQWQMRPSDSLQRTLNNVWMRADSVVLQRPVGPLEPTGRGLEMAPLAMTSNSQHITTEHSDFNTNDSLSDFDLDAYVPYQNDAAEYTAAKKMDCPKCPTQFPRQCDLRKHMKRHQRPFGCVAANCDKTFGAKNDLKRHLSNIHPDLVVAQGTRQNEGEGQRSSS